MYSQFYGFREKPFSLLPDPEFLFLSQKHEKALNLLELGILNQSGFCVISGEIGAGKTTLVRELLNRLDERVRVGLISNTHSGFSDLLGWILAAYELKSESNEAAIQHRRFTDFIIEQYAGGKHTLLIIDEAQNLTLSALEQLRMLSNINSEKDLVLQIILVGQNELRTKLQQPELEQFAQRIAIDYHLAALDQEETAAYIIHRVTKSGGSSRLFDNDACRLVYKYSKGIPRLINLICDFSLVYGFSEHREIIGADLIKAVIEDRMSGKVVMPPAEIPADKPTRVVCRIIPDTRTESDASGKNSISKTLIEKSKADAVLARKAESEKIAAGKFAAEKEAEEEKAATLAETSRAAAKLTEAEKLNAEKNALKITSTTAQATDLVIKKKQAAEQLVVEKARIEEETLKNAAYAKTAAEKALADRIAAEVSAAKIAASAVARARKATAVRVAAELAAARVLAASETAAKHELGRQADAARVVAEKADADKTAIEKARADTELAKKASAGKEAAGAVAREKTLAAQQAAQKAAASRDKAAKALSDMATANALAAEKASLEKVALAKVAVAKQATEKAAAAQKEARIKEAAAEKATRQAAEAIALAEEAKAATVIQPQVPAIQAKRRWNTPGRARAILAFSIISGIMAASLWLITGPGDTGVDANLPVIANKSFAAAGPTTEAAALESEPQ